MGAARGRGAWAAHMRGELGRVVGRVGSLSAAGGTLPLYPPSPPSPAPPRLCQPPRPRTPIPCQATRLPHGRVGDAGVGRRVASGTGALRVAPPGMRRRPGGVPAVMKGRPEDRTPPAAARTPTAGSAAAAHARSHPCPPAPKGAAAAMSATDAPAALAADAPPLPTVVGPVDPEKKAKAVRGGGWKAQGRWGHWMGAWCWRQAVDGAAAQRGHAFPPPPTPSIHPYHQPTGRQEGGQGGQKGQGP